MNDGDLYKVAWGDQLDAAGTVGTGHKAFQTELNDINSATNALKGRWGDSESESAYTARQAKWNQAADNIVAVLAKFKGSLESAAETSSTTEKKAANTMTGA